MGWADDDWRAASARAEQHEIALMQATSKATRDAGYDHLRSQRRGPQAKPALSAGTTLDLGPHRDRKSLENRITKPI
jgi:hypothetical protein